MLNSRLHSFRVALKGIKTLIVTQTNARIHLAISLVVVGLGLYYPITFTEWLFIFLAMGLIWSSEALNTAIEWLVDDLHPHQHPTAGKIKDVAAGGVLLAACFAGIVGLVIFVPEIF